MGVVGGLPDELEEGVHLLKGVKQQRVLGKHLGQHRFARLQGGGELGQVGRVAHGSGALRGQEIFQQKRVFQGNGRFCLEHLLPFQRQPLAQIGHQLLTGASLDLQPHRG